MNRRALAFDDASAPISLHLILGGYVKSLAYPGYPLQSRLD
jgi:hypothetical protein